MTELRYPVGEQDFAKIRTQNMIYVDKTEVLYRLVTTRSYYFLSRPRRFGKSLMLSTLRYYFEGRRELFQGLAMERLEQQWTVHPVIYLDMSSDKKHLILSLFSGEQFENLQNSPSSSIHIPYRRETFVNKQLVIDFDGGFQMQDAGFLSSRADTKDMWKIRESIDSMIVEKDSLHTAFYTDMRRNTLKAPEMNQNQIKKKARRALAETKGITNLPFDSIMVQMGREGRISIIQNAKTRMTNAKSDFEFKQLVIKENERQIAAHWANWHRKITLSLACLVFFFIGAPLGSIIRRGGLGLPVVISVVFFIIYPLISTIAERMAVFGDLNMFLGVWLSSLVLLPVGLFFTFKATTDAALFDGDSWKKFFQRLFKKKHEDKVTEPKTIA